MSPVVKLAALLLCVPCLFSVEADFASPKDIANGGVSGVSSMDAGDINGDGIGDVVVIEGGKHAGGRQTFAWFEGPTNVQGTWKRHNFGNTAPLRSFLGAAKLADMDNDGDLDLIVSSDNHSGSSKKADIFVYVNPGKSNVTGTWSYHTANASVLPVHHFNDMEIADLDDDGKLDIVARSLTPNQIHIFFQNSISNYTHKVIETNISNSEGLSVGYLDSDRYPDITYTGHWLKSPSNPRTQNYTKLNIDSNYKNVNQNTKESIGDIDGDGLNDIVISPAEAYRSGGDTYIAWYKNPGNTSSANWAKYNIVNKTNNTHTIKLGDMDLDGDLDVVTGTPWSNSNSSVSVRVYYNTDGKGAFSAAQVVATGKGLYSGVLFDIDGDGDLEIIGQNKYAGSSKPYVYENLLAGSPPVNQKPVARLSSSTNSGLAPLAITFNGGSSTDADGTISSYAWTFGDGSSASGESTSHTFTSAGTYTVSLTVTDNDGLSDSDSIQITVTEPAAERDAFSRIEAESFDAKKGIGIYNGGTGKKIGSIENNTHAVYHRVNFGTGANMFYASCSNYSSTNSNIEIRLDAVDGQMIGKLNVPVTGGWNAFIDLSLAVESVSGVHDVYLVFTGGGGSLLDVDYFQFGLGAPPTPNQAPNADLQASTTSGEAPLAINFNASASSDSDGSVVSYAWDFGDGNSANAAQVNHTFTDAGTYTVTLTVTDDDGASDSQNVQIQISEAPGETRDAYSRIEAETFDIKKGIGIYNGGTGKKIGSIENGTYAVYQNVDFGSGADRVNASSSNNYSTNSNIEFRLGAVDGSLLGTMKVPVTGGWNKFIDLSIDVQSVSGTHDLYLVFTGGGGALLDVDYFQFEQGVTPVPNQAPIADIQTSANNGQAPAVINFDAGSSSDSDGSIVSYVWNFGDGNNGAGAQLAHTFVSAGVYTVTLTVTDDDGASDSSSVQITITDPPTAGRDAFTRIEAESFDAKQGLAIYNGGTGKKIGSIEDGTYVVYEAVDFASGAASFTASCSNKQSTNSKIEIRLGSKTGTLIGSVSVPVTGGWNNFVDVQTSVSGASGVHDVYLVFTGGDGSLLDVDYFQFAAGNPVVGRDAFSRIEAETYDAMNGIGIYDGGTGQKIGSIENGTHAMYKDVNFGDGATSFDARVACYRRAGSIELRLGSKTGTLIGTCDIPVTGGWENFIDVSCSINQVSGVHDLYFVFTSESTRALFDIDYFQFTQIPATLMTAPTAVSINFQPATAETVTGFLVDSGATFDYRGNGYSYGWSRLNDESRDRNHPEAASQLEDTFNHFSKGEDASWSIALPNGFYDLVLVCGDPLASDQVNNLQIGDQVIIDEDGADHFDRIQVLVEVRDGLLLIKPAAGAQNAKICYLEISALTMGNG